MSPIEIKPDALGTLSATLHRQFELPDEEIVRKRLQFPHSHVEWVSDFVSETLVPDQVDAWFWQDEPRRGRGGRPRTISTHAVVVLFLLLTLENKEQWLKEAAKVIARGLSNNSLRHLGLWGHPDKKTAESWEPALWHALQRFLKPIDSHPGSRRGFRTGKERAADLQMREDSQANLKQQRLDWVVAQFMQTTHRLVDPLYQDEWEGDIAVDATVVPAYAQRGTPRQPDSEWNDPEQRRYSVEPDAGWYLRNSQHKVPEGGKGVRKAVYGWDVTLLVQCKPNPEDITLGPLLIAGVGMTRPGADLVHTSRRLHLGLKERGYRIGRSTGDRGYSSNAAPEDHQIPLRKAGYKLVIDYEDSELGKSESWEGAIEVDGAFYCPSMPEFLHTATKDYKAGRIDHKNWRNYIVERRKYMVRFKEAGGDPAKASPVMCPARGPGATLSCPVAELHGGAAPMEFDGDRTEVKNPPPPELQGRICCNKSSVAIPVKAGAKRVQHFQHQSDEWSMYYRQDRSTVEGVNGMLKAMFGINHSAKRRLRGYTAQLFLITLIIVAYNIYKLEKWRNEVRNAATDEERVVRQQAKLTKRTKRQTKAAERRGAWDGITTAAAAELSPDFAEDEPPPQQE